MNKLIITIIVLLTGLSTRSQCSFSDLFYAQNPDTMAALIDSNVYCYREMLSRPGMYEHRTYINNLYNGAYPWVYHTNPVKEKLFEEFYEKWGYKYPTLLSPLPTDSDYYDAINSMVATDTKYFTSTTKHMPLQYLQWLRVRDMVKKYGTKSVNRLMKSAAQITNL